MDTVETAVRCPSCGAPTSSRFCGHCGALVRSRPAPPEETPASAVPLHEPPEDGHPEAEATGDRRRPSRRRTAVVAVAAVVVAAVAGVLVRPVPEVVTADGLAGPDGSGRTSTRAVTELSPRWDVAWNGSPSGSARVTALHDLGDALLLATDTELIGLVHPTALPDARDRGLQRPVDPVLWRAPAIAGTPRPVEGRLPVVVGHELVWISVATGEIEDRHAVGDAGPWAPAFAVPAGPLLVAPDGTVGLTPEGRLQWRSDDAGEVVGVADDVVVVQRERTVTARDRRTGAERWSRVIARQGLVRAELVDGVLVTTRLGGRVTMRDPATGEELDGVRVGPQPAWGPSWDGETTIVGATDTDVFVRVDATVGIRYSRIRVRGPSTIEDLGELANQDVLRMSEHAGYLVTVGWDTVEVRRGGDVAWTAVDLEHPPATDGNWLALSYGPFGVVGVDGSRTRIQLDPGGPPARRGRTPVLDGHAIVGTPVGVQALDLDTGEPAWSLPLGSWSCCPSHLVGADTIALTAPIRVLGPDGRRRWDEPVSASDRSTRLSGIAPPWLVVADLAGWLPASTRLVRLADGRPGPDLAVGALRGVVVDGSRLFAVDEGPEGATAVVAFDLPAADVRRTAVLEPAWRRPVRGPVELVLADGDVLVVGAAAVEHLDPRSGELRTRTLLPALGMGPVAYGDGRLVRRVDGSTLEAVDLTTGERWTRSFPEPLTAAPTIAGDLVYVADGRPGISGVALATGEPVASVDVDAPEISSLTVAGGVVLAGGPDRLHAFGPPAPPPGPR